MQGLQPATNNRYRQPSVPVCHRGGAASGRRSPRIGRLQMATERDSYGFAEVMRLVSSASAHARAGPFAPVDSRVDPSKGSTGRRSSPLVGPLSYVLQVRARTL